MIQTDTMYSDINGGNFTSLKGTVTYLKKALSDLAGYYDKLDEMEGTEPKVYTQYYKYVNGSRVNCTSDDPKKEGSYQANQDAWNNWKTQYDGVIKTIAVTKGNISTNYAKLAGYKFNQTAAPAAPSNIDTSPKDSDDGAASEGNNSGYKNEGTMDILGPYMEVDGTYGSVGDITYDKDNPALRTFTEVTGFGEMTYTYSVDENGNYVCTISSVYGDGIASSSTTYTSNSDGTITITGDQPAGTDFQFVVLTVDNNGTPCEVPFLYSQGSGIAAGVDGGFGIGDASYIKGLEGETQLMYHDGPTEVDQYYSNYLNQGACDNGQEWPFDLEGNVKGMKIVSST